MTFDENGKAEVHINKDNVSQIEITSDEELTVSVECVKICEGEMFVLFKPISCSLYFPQVVDILTER